MTFKQQKQRALSNLSAAVSVGDADLDILGLLDAINALNDFYTTSSCSGRIAILNFLGGKGLDKFSAKWHRRVSYDEVKDKIEPSLGELWFKYECPIIHVIARSVDDANIFLNVARNAGFKRSGIQSIKEERVLVEVLSTERVEAPVVLDFELVVSESYVRSLVDIANRKFDISAAKIETLRNSVLDF